TNPGTVGTTSSAPRLMPGQGLIVATGALDYPPEYRSMAPRTLSLLGISKVMTVTSTYDHRIIQGAESGLFLARLEELLRGLAGTDRLTLREILEILRDTYCSTIGVEYMFIADRERKAWLQVRMESCRNRTPLDTKARRRILEKLVEAESFERFLHTKYIGHKRFSLEGCE